MMDNNLVTQFIEQINNAIDYKLSGLTQIKSAIVHSVNQNGTVNIYIPPGQTIYHNVQNQSIYRKLQPGDHIKIIVENGNLSNIWIIGGFQLQSNVTGQDGVQSNINIDDIYPIGSIYMSVNSVGPQVLFGGQWEQIEDRFLLGAGVNYNAGDMGGESEHILTTKEMPRHTHQVTYYLKIADDYGIDLLVGSKAAAVKTSDKVMEMAGENYPHNNMPPYLTVYIWKRVG